MSENKWRFPASNFGTKKGISTGDAEAFKKSPFQAFAREVLQNSIDARESTDKPTIVEFEIFKMRTVDIPGYDDLKVAMKRCIDFWLSKEDYVKKYKRMLEVLDKDSITCLRVSDFNTTGLVGVESNKQSGNKFLALVKGTGVSEKTNAVSGGSKGVGKNAVFLMSSIGTVFYSTHTNQDINGNNIEQIGSMGVSELVSGYIDDVEQEHRDYTQGTGYYCEDEYNSSLKELCNLMDGYNKRETYTGTDIFILGFENNDEWKKDVINSILDSFMATIVRNELEVNIDGLVINSSTVENVVYDDKIIAKANKSNIVSQYRLLKGDGVSTYEIETDYGSCDLYVLPYSKEEESLSTHKCSMIRCPLMKIKDESLGSSFRVSAMCIIGDGPLGEILRSIENPQHIDWEPRRITDLAERKEVENVIKSIKEQIRENVISCLKLGDDEPIDPNGAAEYLPFEEEGKENNSGVGSKEVGEEVSISSIRENQTYESHTNEDASGDVSGLEPDIGTSNPDEDGDAVVPEGNNEGEGGAPREGPNTEEVKPGDNEILVKKRLSGVKYRVVKTDPNSTNMVIKFIAPGDYDKCYLALKILDDKNNGYSLEINNIEYNGKKIESENKFEVGPFSIERNKQIILKVNTNQKGHFGTEVKVYASEE